MKHATFVMTLLVCVPAYAVQDEKGFTSLIDAKMSNFGTAGGSPKTWSVEDGVIKCTGTPNGYFYTKKKYRNYVLKADFRFPQGSGNSGYLMNITGDHKVWPRCVEVQGHYGSVGMIFPIGGAEGKRPPYKADVRKQAIKPPQEWNSIEIISKNGNLTAIVNGKTVCASTEPFAQREGLIGFQSEGKEIHFRKIRIKETD